MFWGVEVNIKCTCYLALSKISLIFVGVMYLELPGGLPELQLLSGSSSSP